MTVEQSYPWVVTRDLPGGGTGHQCPACGSRYTLVYDYEGKREPEPTAECENCGTVMWAPRRSDVG